VANPKWGGKHTCQHCGVKYYDLNRSPIVCPKCGAQFNPDALLRSRRSKPTPPDKAAAPQAAAVAPTAKKDVEADDQLEAENLVTAEVDDDADKLGEDDEKDKLGEDDEKDKLIEDVSELGEDEDDIAEVVVEGDEPKDT
jgi:uncharacterized protein (TIGR02300 family)